jgi:hemolysin activation/secretion protein
LQRAVIGVLLASAAGHARAVEPERAPAPAVNTAAQSTPADAAPHTASEETFPIVEFRVLGNHVLDRTKVEAAVYPFLGANRTFDTVRKAQEALVAAYHDAGFGTVLVDIPEQTVDDGVVRLKVTEGKIERVRVEGTKYFSNRRILAALPSIAPGTVPRLPDLQSELGTLQNEARDRQITPVLRGGSAPGTVEIDLKVKDRPAVHASLEADNRYTADTSHTRLSANVSYDNMFQRSESLALTYQLSPSAPSEVKLWVLSYTGRLPAPEWGWSAYAIRSDSNVAALGTLSVIGNGKIFGGRLVRTFGGSPTGVNSLTLGVDYKSFGQNLLLPGDINSTNPNPVQYSTPIHYLMWSAQLSATRLHEKYDLTGNVALNLGVNGIGGHDTDFQFKRFGASGSFAYLRGSGSATWRFWRGVSLVGRTSFQYSEAPLINNEQFSLGGEDTVRGYLEAEELVDSGIAGTVELQSPKLAFARTETFSYLFYDRGIGMNQQPLPSEVEKGLVRSDLAGYGVGFQTLAFQRLKATFELARPRLSGSRTQRGDGRVNFSVLYGF